MREHLGNNERRPRRWSNVGKSRPNFVAMKYEDKQLKPIRNYSHVLVRSTSLPIERILAKISDRSNFRRCAVSILAKNGQYRLEDCENKSNSEEETFAPSQQRRRKAILKSLLQTFDVERLKSISEKGFRKEKSRPKMTPLNKAKPHKGESIRVNPQIGSKLARKFTPIQKEVDKMLKKL